MELTIKFNVGDTIYFYDYKDRQIYSKEVLKILIEIEKDCGAPIVKYLYEYEAGEIDETIFVLEKEAFDSKRALKNHMIKVVQDM